MSIQKNRIGSLFLVLLMAAVMFACTWEEVQLEMQFSPEVGDVYLTRMDMQQQIVQTFEGETMTTTQNMNFLIRMEATAVEENGDVWMDLTYDEVQIEMGMAPNLVTYDSTNPPADPGPEVAIFSVFVDNGFAMRIDPEGNIVEVTGVESMVDDMIAVLTEDEELPPDVIGQLREQLGAQFNNETMEDQMGQMIVDFPSGSVNAGDQWTASMAITTTLPMETDTWYTLNDFNTDTATLGITGTINALDGDPVELGAITATYSLTGYQEGTAVLDINTGLATDSHITQTISGEMQMYPPFVQIGRASEPTVIPIDIFSIVRVEMVKEESE